jgi:hypothetical protein
MHCPLFIPTSSVSAVCLFTDFQKAESWEASDFIQIGTIAVQVSLTWHFSVDKIKVVQLFIYLTAVVISFTNSFPCHMPFFFNN